MTTMEPTRNQSWARHSLELALLKRFGRSLTRCRNEHCGQISAKSYIITRMKPRVKPEWQMS